MSLFWLKCIALATMTIDHLGKFVWPNAAWCSLIGRLAFPIYAFLIVNGYRHTKNVRRYALRLGLFALLSEVPFDLMVFGTPFDLAAQNVFFTLFLGLLAIWCGEQQEGRYRGSSLLLCMAAATLFATDYSLFGVGLIWLYHWAGANKGKQLAATGGVFLLMSALDTSYLLIVGDPQWYLGLIQLFGLFALPLIWRYDQRKGPSLQYLFYLYYPLHMVGVFLLGRAI